MGLKTIFLLCYSSKILYCSMGLIFENEMPRSGILLIINLLVKYNIFLKNARNDKRSFSAYRATKSILDMFTRCEIFHYIANDKISERLILIHSTT